MTDPIALRELEAERLWVVEHELRVGGMELGRRMTIVRLRDARARLRRAFAWLPDAPT